MRYLPQTPANYLSETYDSAKPVSQYKQYNNMKVGQDNDENGIICKETYLAHGQATIEHMLFPRAAIKM